MALWEADDNFTRWLHGLCAIPVILFAIFDYYLLRDGYQSRAGYYAFDRYTSAEGSSFCGAIYLAYRLLWYAFTGKNCLNRDDYDSL